LRPIGAIAPLVLSIIFGCSGGSHNVSPEPDAGDTDTDSTDSIPGWEMTWAINEGSTETIGHIEVGDAVVALEDGDAVVAGRYFPGAVFAEGLPEEVEPPQYGDVDGFLAWYSPSGELRRLRTVCGIGQEIMEYALAVPSGGVAACSIGSETVHLDSGSPGEDSWTVDLGPNPSFLVARYGAQGSLLWVRNPSDSTASYCSGMLLLADSTIVTSGSFQGELSVKSAGFKTPTTIESDGGYDMYGVAYDLEGEFLWLSKLVGGGLGLSYPDPAATPDGGFLVACELNGDEEVVVGQGSTNEIILSPNGGASVFAAKYDSSGVPLWAFDLGIEGVVHGVVGIDTYPDGDFVISFLFRGSFLIDSEQDGNAYVESASGGAEISLFLARYSGLGEPVWVRSVGPMPDNQPDNQVNVSVTEGGEIAVCGSCKEGTKFGEGEPTETVIPDGIFHAAFTALYGPNGDFRWVVHHGKHGENICWGVDTLGDNTVFSTGGFWGEDVAFGTSPEDTVYLSGKGGTQDIYVTRMDRVQAPR